MKSKITISKVKKVRREMTRWIRTRYGSSAVMMLDLSDGELWADLFIDHNTYKAYKSENIIKVPIRDILETKNHPLSYQDLDKSIYQWCLRKMEHRNKTTEDLYDQVLLSGMGNNYYIDLLNSIGKSPGEEITEDEYVKICEMIQYDSENLYAE